MDDSGLEGDTVIDALADAIEATETVVRGSTPLPAILNGGFTVWQEATSFPSIASTAWGPDGWRYTKSGAVVHDLLRSTDVPAVAASAPRVSYSLHLDVTTADSSIGSGDYAAISTRVEGFDWAPFDQKEWTLPFWAKGSKTGPHYVFARNSGSDRSCVIAYTIDAADTWELKSVTFPANPSSGTWEFTTGRGIEIGWCLAAGSTYHTTAGAWQTGDFLAASDQVNELDSTSNNFRIALVGPPTLGPLAAPFAPVPIALEITRARRYLRRWGGIGSTNEVVAFGMATSTTNAVLFIPLGTPMRVVPAMSVSSAGHWALQVSGGGLIECTSVTMEPHAGIDTVAIQAVVAAGLTAGDAVRLLADTTADARLYVVSRVP